MGTIIEKTVYVTSDGQHFADKGIAERYESLLTQHGYDRVKRLHAALCKHNFTEAQTATIFASLRLAATNHEVHDALRGAIQQEIERSEETAAPVTSAA